MSEVDGIKAAAALIREGGFVAGFGFALFGIAYIAKFVYEIWNTTQAKKRLDDNPAGYQSNASVIAASERVAKHLSATASNLDKLADIVRDIAEGQRAANKETERMGRQLDQIAQKVR